MDLQILHTYQQGMGWVWTIVAKAAAVQRVLFIGAAQGGSESHCLSVNWHISSYYYCSPMQGSAKCAWLPGTSRLYFALTERKCEAAPPAVAYCHGSDIEH